MLSVLLLACLIWVVFVTVVEVCSNVTGPAHTVGRVHYAGVLWPWAATRRGVHDRCHIARGRLASAL